MARPVLDHRWDTVAGGTGSGPSRLAAFVRAIIRANNAPFTRPDPRPPTEEETRRAAYANLAIDRPHMKKES